MGPILTAAQVHEEQFLKELAMLCQKHRITPLMAVYYVQGNPRTQMGRVKLGTASKNWCVEAIGALKVLVEILEKQGHIK